MTSFFTYLYKDPKTDTWRYVGQGKNKRPFEHFSKRSDTQLSRMLKKGIKEGFNPQPILISAVSSDDAKEMEILLITMLGREDLGLGTLFNKTDGGDGCIGRVPLQSELDNRSKTLRSKSKEEWQDITSRSSIGRKIHYDDPEWVAKHSERVRMQMSRRCTIDGVTIFESRKDLIEILGQSRATGSRSPNFRYV